MIFNKTVIFLGLSLLFSSCLFEDDSPKNPFIGTWKAISSENQFVSLGRDSLVRDSLWNRFAYPISGVRRDDSTMSYAEELEYLSLVYDPIHQVQTDSIVEYFYNCESEICLDTLYIQTEQRIFTSDSVSARVYRDGQLHIEHTTKYSYSNDSIYFHHSNIESGSLVSMPYLFVGDTLITPGDYGDEIFVKENF